MQKLNIGILWKGFTVKSTTMEVKIPVNTAIVFDKENEEIICQGFPAKFLKINKDWFCQYFGQLLLVEFDHDRPPYPISFFERPSKAATL
jgi:hypothetical protein